MYRCHCTTTRGQADLQTRQVSMEQGFVQFMMLLIHVPSSSCDLVLLALQASQTVMRQQQRRSKQKALTFMILVRSLPLISSLHRRYQMLPLSVVRLQMHSDHRLESSASMLAPTTSKTARSSQLVRFCIFDVHGHSPTTISDTVLCGQCERTPLWPMCRPSHCQCAGNAIGSPVECLFFDDGVRLAVPASGFDTYSMISSTRAQPPLGDLVPVVV